MAFDDTSRIVVSEGSPPAAGSPPPSAGKRADKSSPSNKSRPKSGRAGAAISGGRHRHGKPDGFGSISCVHTFPTGLVVSTGSDGTVSEETSKECNQPRAREVDAACNVKSMKWCVQVVYPNQPQPFLNSAARNQVA